MRKYEFDSGVCDGWKSYPIRLTLPERLSNCCSKPVTLVQSMKGGFVTVNCMTCGNKVDNLIQAEFERLPFIASCPECRHDMIAGKMDYGIDKGNYCYCCESCQIYIKLADLLPSWEELVQH